MEVSCGDKAMTDQEIKRIIENSYKTGAVESPETIMQERISLKITPYALHLLFRKAYIRYCLRKETSMCIYAMWVQVLLI